MDSITAIAAAGLRARVESLDLLANNIANASTGGYKADREFYSLYVAPEASENEPPSTMPLVEKPWTDLSQGVLQYTGGPLDLALSGKGFFAVNGPGGTLYTRNGSFQLDAKGQLAAQGGYPVRDTNGQPILLDAQREIEIDGDGSVRQDGTDVARIAVVDFADPTGLAKQGSNYFRAAGSAPVPEQAATASVEQGKLEGSNTGAAESAVRLMAVMRQFEALQKAAAVASDMNRKAIQEVARVGS